MQQEKRKFSRINLPFELTIFLEDWSSFIIDQVTDISIGGCLIPSRPEFENQKYCRICIRLGESAEHVIEVEGEFVRAVGDGVAIQFNKIDPDSLHHLQNLILYNAPDPDIINSELKDHKGIK